MYDGYWKEGKMHGKGKLSFENGDYFQGEFVAGVRNGVGTLFIKSGKRVSGIWVDDKFQELI